DSLNDYYDVRLKQARLAHIGSPNQFHFAKLNLCDHAGIKRLFAKRQPEIVINLAAQAGVRYSLENPHSYIESNLVGFTNILEACRHFEVEHLVYASSSSVYGLNKEMPFHEGQNVDHPVALYGATKKANELLAHSYSHLFSLPTTGLRFFTVYGPWGRPDMALFKFAEAILAGQPIDIYNHGMMTRDFTFIDDIVKGVVRTAMKPAEHDKQFDAKIADAGRSSAPWMIFNIGNGKPTPLMDYIAALEHVLGKEAKKNFLDIQPGDVVATASDTSRLSDWVGFVPNTPINIGVGKFVEWYKAYYHKDRA
ncbi:MAG: NAD-dependent epimerase/dehydratase family protein, partial [Alphaproteobacteria bacterium]|nr:NAD-dependent epimerase/dehydratase family protein [Alphaproteobacteria bacterium]